MYERTENGYIWGDKTRVASGRSTQVVEANGTYTVNADFTTHAGEIALGERVYDVTTQVTSNASTHSNQFNIPTAGVYLIRVRMGNQTASLPKAARIDLRGLQTVGAVGGRTGSYFDVGPVRFYRTAQQTLIYGLVAEGVTDGQDVDIDIYELEADGVLSTEGVPDPIYQTLAAQVDLPISQTAGEYGTLTEVWRYTNTSTETKHYLIFADIDPQADWAPASGADRAGARFRVRHLDSAGTAQTTPDPIADDRIYVRNGNGTYEELSAYGFWFSAVSVKLEPNDYVLIEGQAAAQIAGAGRNVIIATTDAHFQIQEQVAAGTAVSPGQMQAEASTASGPFTNVAVAWAEPGVVLTSPLALSRYNGASYSFPNPWHLIGNQPPRPANNSILWLWRFLVTPAPGSAEGFRLDDVSLAPSEDHIFSATRYPLTGADISLTPITGGYASVYLASIHQWSGWFRLGSDRYDWVRLDTAQHFPIAHGTTSRLDFASFGFDGYAAMMVVLRVYRNGAFIQGHPFVIDNPAAFIQIADRAVDVRSSGQHLNLWMERDITTNRRIHDWSLDELATSSIGANRYDEFGCTVEFQRPSGITTGLLVDSMLIGANSTWNVSRELRVDVELWRRG